MDQGTLFLTILGMWAVTFAVKVGPIALLARRRLPPAVIETIRPLPIAILAALLVPNVLMSEGALAIEPGNYFIWGALVAFLVHLAIRNLLSTVLAGMAAVALLRLVFGS